VTNTLSRYSNLTQRIITGVLGSAVVIAGICYSEWAYFGLFFILCLFAMREFYILAAQDGMMPERIFGIVCGLFLYTLTFLVARHTVPPSYYMLIFPLTTCVYIVKLYKKSERKPFSNIGFTFLGVFYLALPLSLLHLAVFNDGVYNFEIIFGILFILWASDTGAYFAGTYLGKHKLFPRISPKKSWEGFAGGALLALIFAYGLAQYFHSLSLLQWIVVGVIIIVGGTFGDLVESLFKRSIEIKDSGTALPGHGGFLDRFDGLFISAPFIVAYLEIF
jgi:phosphatidate cytidylyltransferase